MAGISKFYFRENSHFDNLQIGRPDRAPLDNNLNGNRMHEMNLLSKVSLEAVCLANHGSDAEAVLF